MRRINAPWKRHNRSKRSNNEKKNGTEKLFSGVGVVGVVSGDVGADVGIGVYVFVAVVVVVVVVVDDDDDDHDDDDDDDDDFCSQPMLLPFPRHWPACVQR